MKRREFLSSIGAVGTVSLLPNAAIARVGLPAALIGRAEHMASLWVHSSANMFKNAFGLDDATATALFDNLSNRGVLERANRFGVARASIPCFENPIYLAKRELVRAQVKTSAVSKSNTPDVKETVQKVNDYLDETLEDAEEPLDVPETNTEVSS